jgi:hypothetical protein
MKKILVIALLVLLFLVPSIAQVVEQATATTQDMTDVLSIIQTITLIGVPFLPLVIVIGLTQGLKKWVYTNIEDKLKNIITFFTPFVLSALVHLLFSTGEGLLKYAQYVAGTWAFAALGFDGIKALFFKPKVEA